MGLTPPSHDHSQSVTSDLELASSLERLGTPITSPRGTMLFQQGQPSTGVLVLRKGRVRLTFDLGNGHHAGKTVRPGHVLGLLAAVSEQPYAKTAKTLDDCELTSVDRTAVMGLLERRKDFWLTVVSVIADEIRLIRKRVRPAAVPKDRSDAATAT
jgi:CRP/FNR family cyclic AMP-dependent transcriptional regulator